MPTKKKPTIKQLQGEVAALNDALSLALGASPETDHNFFTGGMSSAYTDRSEWDRRKVFSEALRAWRVNPTARRIVRLNRSFVLGKGITIKSDDPDTETMLQAWWNHRLNKLKVNTKRWKDEDTRTGNLFLLCTIGADTMLYVRAIGSEMIEEIITEKHDIEQEIGYKVATGADIEATTYPSYEHRGGKNKFIVHYASNRPVGSSWGEADISPMLPWIGRYSSWLEDRVRLNRFRNAFMWIVMMTGADVTPEKKRARQAELNSKPPTPGTVLVTDPTEQWGIMSANLDSFDASMDGTAIKKHIMDGAGQPMHWHAEGESSISTTAEAAGTPTFRTLEEQQDEFFEWMIDLAYIALEIAGKALPKDKKIWIEGPDITERDNASLALAFARTYPMLSDLYDREGIDSKEFLRLAYKMLAETHGDKVPEIKRKPLVKQDTSAEIRPPADDQTDPGDPKEQPSE